MNDDLILIESRTMRAKFRGQVDALDKVGALVMLPDTVTATVEMAADYFEVEANTLRQVIKRNRAELESNGLRTLRGDDLREWKGRYKAYLPSEVVNSSQLTLLTRQTILNIGQLLTESAVAAAIRKYLILLDQTATEEHKVGTLKLARLQERKDYKNILTALKRGGAVSGEDYRHVQNTLYIGLFGKSASEIKSTQEQQTGEYYKKQPDKLKPSKVAKDYLTEAQLKLLDCAVLAATAQLEARFPNGTSVAQMEEVVRASVAHVRPRRAVA